MYSNITILLNVLWNLFLPGQTPVLPRSSTWILDLWHEPIWAIWLAEVSIFHQNHDRIDKYAGFVVLCTMCFFIFE